MRHDQEIETNMKSQQVHHKVLAEPAIKPTKNIWGQKIYAGCEVFFATTVVNAKISTIATIFSSANITKRFLAGSDLKKGDSLHER